MYPLNDTHNGLILFLCDIFWLLRKPTNIQTGFLFFYSKIFRTNHLTHHQLNVTSVTSTPHTLTNAHCPWACRGMPFDDVCQIAPQGANLSARWSGDVAPQRYARPGRDPGPSTLYQDQFLPPGNL